MSWRQWEIAIDLALRLTRASSSYEFRQRRYIKRNSKLTRTTRIRAQKLGQSGDGESVRSFRMRKISDMPWA